MKASTDGTLMQRVRRALSSGTGLAAGLAIGLGLAEPIEAPAAGVITGVATARGAEEVTAALDARARPTRA